MSSSKSGLVTLFRGMLGLCCLAGMSIAAPPGEGRVNEDKNIGAYNNVGALIQAGYKIHTDQIPFAVPVQADRGAGRSSLPTACTGSTPVVRPPTVPRKSRTKAA